MVNGNYSDMGVYKDVQEDDTHPQSAHTYVHSPPSQHSSSMRWTHCSPRMLVNCQFATVESLAFEGWGTQHPRTHAMNIVFSGGSVLARPPLAQQRIAVEAMAMAMDGAGNRTGKTEEEEEEEQKRERFDPLPQTS